MVLELKSMMKGPVLEMAREVVKKVAEELTKELEQEIRPALTGRMDRFRAVRFALCGIWI